MDEWAERLRELLAGAGFAPGEPVVVGLRRAGEPSRFAARGVTADGRALTEDTVVDAGSLAQQVVAACLALLVAEGVVDLEDTLDTWLPEFPPWARAVRLRHLALHTGALPDDEVDAMLADADRTSAAVLGALGRVPVLFDEPGTVFRPAGCGYVCLARVVERASGQPLSAFAEQWLLGPLALAATLFWPGPRPGPPGAVPLSPTLPARFCLGDAGLWSSARDLLRWAEALNADRLGVAALMDTPGTLADGTELEVAWGQSVCGRAGARLLWHDSGDGPGPRVLLARAPGRGVGLVVLTLAGDARRRQDLAASLADGLVTAPARCSR